MKHVRYESVGNKIGIIEVVDDYWEISDDGHVTRSVHVQPDGSHLKYDQANDADRFGALPEGMITAEMLVDRTVGKITIISAADFDARWTLKAKNESA